MKRNPWAVLEERPERVGYEGLFYRMLDDDVGRSNDPDVCARCGKPLGSTDVFCFECLEPITLELSLRVGALDAARLREALRRRR